MDQSKKVKHTTIIRKYPSYRDEDIKSCWRWLEGRQEDDNAEGLWRVYDKIYNLNDFIKAHPGGKEWLELTKGTDITEAFESYHILPKASQILTKFYVKEADKRRNYLLTFNENGFYKTLKARVAEKLPTVDKSDEWKTKLYFDFFVFGFLLCSIMAVRLDAILWKLFFVAFGAQFAEWLNVAAHNFTHQRNNWRMYLSSFVLVSWRDWRVFHGMSHHLYPNSYTDLEVTAYEPFIRWIPTPGYRPFKMLNFYFASLHGYFHLFFIIFYNRMMGFFYARKNNLHWDDSLALFPLLVMFIAGNSSYNVLNFFTTWLILYLILSGGGFLYSCMAINVGHHGKTLVHQGDEFRDLDFGIYQLATTVDRIGANRNLGVALTNFGDHVLHHLFPSLDQSILPHFRDILVETCKEFDVEYRKWTFMHAAVEQFRQLNRTENITLDKKIENNNDLTSNFNTKKETNRNVIGFTPKEYDYIDDYSHEF